MPSAAFSISSRTAIGSPLRGEPLRSSPWQQLSRFMAEGKLLLPHQLLPQSIVVFGESGGSLWTRECDRVLAKTLTFWSQKHESKEKLIDSFVYSSVYLASNKSRTSSLWNTEKKERNCCFQDYETPDTTTSWGSQKRVQHPFKHA